VFGVVLNAAMPRLSCAGDRRTLAVLAPQIISLYGFAHANAAKSFHRIEPFCFEVVEGVEVRMPLRAYTTNGGAAPSFNPAIRAGETQDLTSEQDYRVRVMGEEELELLRAAASQGGLQLASLNWILASLMNHGFVTINGSDRRLRAVATKAGYLAVARRPLPPDDTLSLD
jgi:hypothetical protein